jgi:hypothetical protein
MADLKLSPEPSTSTKSVPVTLWLAAGILLGFFAILLAVFVFGVPDNGGEVLMIMVGTLTSLTGNVVQYYFGSSAGSKSKEEALLDRERLPRFVGYDAGSLPPLTLREGPDNG